MRHPKAMPPACPSVWLISDARNDAALERALRRLPRGSGLVFRHYHLRPADRKRRFDQLARVAKGRDHVVALAGSPGQARAWGADAVYGPPNRMTGAAGLLRLATVHSLREMGAARRARADVIVLSAVFATRSHPEGAVLGAAKALLLARHALGTVIVLGGMNALRWRALGRAPQLHGWAAIDGLSTE